MIFSSLGTNDNSSGNGLQFVRLRTAILPATNSRSSGDEPQSGDQNTAVGEANRRNPRYRRNHRIATTTQSEPRSGGQITNTVNSLATAPRLSPVDRIYRGLHPRLCSGHAYGVLFYASPHTNVCIDLTRTFESACVNVRIVAHERSHCHARTFE